VGESLWWPFALEVEALGEGPIGGRSSFWFFFLAERDIGWR
jgi:hypothetical protein